jgi:hypothetical protein
VCLEGYESLTPHLVNNLVTVLMVAAATVAEAAFMVVAATVAEAVPMVAAATVAEAAAATGSVVGVVSPEMISRGWNLSPKTRAGEVDGSLPRPFRSLKA